MFEGEENENAPLLSHKSGSRSNKEEMLADLETGIDKAKDEEMEPNSSWLLKKLKLF